MYCGNCGAVYPDGSAFCKQCGAKLGGAKPISPVDPAGKPVPKSSNQNRTVGIIAVAVLAVVLLVVGILLFGGRSYKSTVKQFFNAAFDANAKKIIQLVPKKVVNAAIEDEYDDLDDFIKDGNKALKGYINLLDEIYGDDWKVSYEIVDTEEITGKSLKSIKNEYEDEYDVKVSAAMEVEVELTIKHGKEKETSTMYLSLIKVGSSWYLDVENMSVF